jgi:hypothetical protein
MKRDLHQRVKNNVRHEMSIIFLPNDKLNHKRSSSGVVGADEPLQWGRALERARVVSLTAANGGPAPVLPAGPAAGENENDRLR